MELTDLDELSPEEFDRKRKKELDEYWEKMPRYSKREMLDFARHYHLGMLTATVAMSYDAEKAFSDWTDESQ